MDKQIEEAKKELKQIDEIAKLICNYPQCINYNIIGGCKIAECHMVDIAKNLYKQGYRKQVQGEWIYHEAVLTDDGLISVYACSNCNACVYEEDFHQDYFHKNYCGNCGAKMKGN